MYEAMLTTQENQCIDMVAFDEELKSINRALFPAAPKAVAPRSRDQNQKLLLEQMMGLQRLDPAQCEQRLQDSDPLIDRARQEATAITRFMNKYKSFL